MIKQSFILILIATLFLSCGNKVASKKLSPNDLNWIEGTWLSERNYFGQGLMGENWIMKPDTLVGIGFVINEDTLPYEQISIYAMGDTTLAYSVYLNEKNTVFMLDTIDKERAKFTNYSNEFPQEIQYKNDTINSTIIITLTGYPGGIRRELNFELSPNNGITLN